MDVLHVCGAAVRGVFLFAPRTERGVASSVGGGWGAEVRPNRYSATPLLVYAMDTDTVDITVTDNVFENVGAYGLVYKAGGLDKLPKGYRIFDNRQGRR